MTQMSGAAFLAETMHGYGVTHFFFMPVIVDDAMPHMEKLGITRVMATVKSPRLTWRTVTHGLKDLSVSVAHSRLGYESCCRVTRRIPSKFPSYCSDRPSDSGTTRSKRLPRS
ncbi:MAG: hypothetical protein CM1200mP39_12180 [Dehalococcoidia bacterium]|nr:MAG: hypothetical protein CM1200mP39_12180 [Dehalococcoidia bacterium]